MIFIENTSTSPYFNLACEEYCLTNLDFDEDIVMLWRDDNTIVVGKYQNTVEEINHEFVAENKVNVVRRVTGGGAVYHDLGNLNFTFILNVDRTDMIDMKKYALPIIQALKEIGVTAELSGRNDITIDGRKISGTAQRLHKNKLLYHGTLLFDSDMGVLSKALKVSIDKIESKGIKSVRSRVVNIKEYLNKDYDVLEFKKLILYHLFKEQPYKEYKLTDKDMEAIKSLEKERYSKWEWIYGKSPSCNLRNSKRFPGGKVEVLLNISNGVIEGCKIYGDFLGVSNIEDVENTIIGNRYDKEDIEKSLININISEHFGSITKDEIVSCFFK